MVTRHPGNTPVEPRYPRCDNADHCYQAHYDLDAGREITDAQQRLIEELHRRNRLARALLAGHHPDRIALASAVLDGTTPDDILRGER